MAYRSVSRGFLADGFAVGVMVRHKRLGFVGPVYEILEAIVDGGGTGEFWIAIERLGVERFIGPDYEFEIVEII